MKTFSLRHLLVLTVASALLSPLAAGCGAEKRIRECAVKCEEALKECERHKEKGCDERGRRCGDECKKL